MSLPLVYITLRRQTVKNPNRIYLTVAEYSSYQVSIIENAKTKVTTSYNKYIKSNNYKYEWRFSNK